MTPLLFQNRRIQRCPLQSSLIAAFAPLVAGVLPQAPGSACPVGCAVGGAVVASAAVLFGVAVVAIFNQRV